MLAVWATRDKIRCGGIRAWPSVDVCVSVKGVTYVLMFSGAQWRIPKWHARNGAKSINSSLLPEDQNNVKQVSFFLDAIYPFKTIIKHHLRFSSNRRKKGKTLLH